ncbi:hypothetical protein GRI89_12260 [Altererythrobacter salegens]|uniref:Uncharacterized protein n=1 Tax=Croceibacterium salegens TaxID=1737568 RepID=A0A6I4T0X7_9SPHN|nr:hypothetical protein [Croceibacterium salegens]MXO60312.1 hypothetical protein [Croceibacterium salegens]
MQDESEAVRLANEISGGFHPVATLLSVTRTAALLRDGADRLALVAPCGAHFVSRLLSPKSRFQRQADKLKVLDGKLAGEFDIGATGGDWERAFARLR